MVLNRTEGEKLFKLFSPKLFKYVTNVFKFNVKLTFILCLSWQIKN